MCCKNNKSVLQENGKKTNISSPTFLALVSILLTKFLGFQFNLLLSFITFPIWSFNFAIWSFNFATLRRKNIRGYLGISRENLVYKLLWSSYVFVMLSGLLGLGFLLSGLMVRNIIKEKPVEIREILNFDYTKINPVAYVPISGISNNHKLQLLVSLTMPESDYNRQLGIFQVRVEMVSSATGKVTANTSKACMLEFRSKPIGILKTVIKSAPLLAGFISESQILNIKLNQLTLQPQQQKTAYLIKVMLESRAEYKSQGTGIGIPQIYEASLSLQSHIPPFQRLLWNWKITLFVWTTFFFFFIQLLFVLLFFTPLLLPHRKL